MSERETGAGVCERGDERCAVTDRRQAGVGGDGRPLMRLWPQGLLESPAVRSE